MKTNENATRRKFAGDFMSFTSVTPFQASLLDLKYLWYEKETVHSIIPKTPQLIFCCLYFRSYLAQVGSFFWDISGNKSLFNLKFLFFFLNLPYISNLLKSKTSFTVFLRAQKSRRSLLIDPWWLSWFQRYKHLKKSKVWWAVWMRVQIVPLSNNIHLVLRIRIFAFHDDIHSLRAISLHFQMKMHLCPRGWGYFGNCWQCFSFVWFQWEQKDTCFGIFLAWKEHPMVLFQNFVP